MTREFFEEPAPSKAELGLILKWGASLIAVGFALVLLLHFFGVIGAVASAPGRVVSKTLETENIIGNYEWFFDTRAQYQARVGQIASHTDAAKSESDPAEKSRLNIELSAMRQSCRELVAKYNANSEKANKSLFKSRGLPDSLQQTDCEAK